MSFREKWFWSERQTWSFFLKLKTKKRLTTRSDLKSDSKWLTYSGDDSKKRPTTRTAAVERAIQCETGLFRRRPHWLASFQVVGNYIGLVSTRKVEFEPLTLVFWTRNYEWKLYQMIFTLVMKTFNYKNRQWVLKTENKNCIKKLIKQKSVKKTRNKSLKQKINYEIQKRIKKNQKGCLKLLRA